MAENILVVEDDAIVRLSISEALQSAGYAVTEARDGEQAHKHLNERRFDLVILDFVLPKVHGFNLIDEFRSNWRRTPLIVISGYLSKAAAEVILEGLADFIQKPIDTATLVSVVRDKLGHYK
jgi:DNA-binding NtrC family response regulator